MRQLKNKPPRKKTMKGLAAFLDQSMNDPRHVHSQRSEAFVLPVTVAMLPTGDDGSLLSRPKMRDLVADILALCQRAAGDSFSAEARGPYDNRSGLRASSTPATQKRSFFAGLEQALGDALQHGSVGPGGTSSRPTDRASPLQDSESGRVVRFVTSVPTREHGRIRFEPRYPMPTPPRSPHPTWMSTSPESAAQETLPSSTSPTSATRLSMLTTKGPFRFPSTTPCPGPGITESGSTSTALVKMADSTATPDLPSTYPPLAPATCSAPLDLSPDRQALEPKMLEEARQLAKSRSRPTRLDLATPPPIPMEEASASLAGRGPMSPTSEQFLLLKVAPVIRHRSPLPAEQELMRELRPTVKAALAILDLARAQEIADEPAPPPTQNSNPDQMEMEEVRMETPPPLVMQADPPSPRPQGRWCCCLSPPHPRSLPVPERPGSR